MIKIRRNFKGSGEKPQRIKEGEKQRNLFYLQKFRKIKNHPTKIRSSCEKNFQGKEPSYENEVILWKTFASKKAKLRKFSQLRTTLQAHMCHFTTFKAHFAATKWVAKSLKQNFAWSGFKLWKFSQLRTTLQAHVCHFAAFKTHFTTVKWVANSPAKSLSSCEMGL